MNLIKQLAGQTAVYGLSSIIARILNYLLVPLYTRVFDTEQYGVVTELYAYVAILIVLLTYGLETGYFRFSRGKDNEQRVFSVAVTSIVFTGILFSVLLTLFAGSAATFLGQGHQGVYIWMLGLTVSMDAMVAVPYARLRLQNNSWKFAMLKTINIGINISMNLFFLLLIPLLRKKFPEFHLLEWFPKEFGVGYIFLSNLIASFVNLVFFLPAIANTRRNWNWKLYIELLKYSIPLMIAGMAGILNETIDRLILKYRAPEALNAMSELGIYGANIKIAVLMTLFVQMYRYAAEPFFFGQYHENKEKFADIYSVVNRLYLYTAMTLYAAIVFFMDLFQYFIGEEFRAGIGIVPVVLASNLLLGVFFNLSFWYKLNDKTKYAAYITLIGVMITVVVNWIYVPRFSYYASAWAHLLSAFGMVVICYFMAKRVFDTSFKVVRLFFVGILFAGLIILERQLEIENRMTEVFIRLGLLTLMVMSVFFAERNGIRRFLDLMTNQK